MAKFNLENYETVEDRLKQYWKDNPNGRIFTEVVHETDDGSVSYTHLTLPTIYSV